MAEVKALEKKTLKMTELVRLEQIMGLYLQQRNLHNLNIYGRHLTVQGINCGKSLVIKQEEENNSTFFCLVALTLSLSPCLSLSFSPSIFLSLLYSTALSLSLSNFF